MDLLELVETICCLTLAFYVMKLRAHMQPSAAHVLGIALSVMALGNGAQALHLQSGMLSDYCHAIAWVAIVVGLSAQLFEMKLLKEVWSTDEDA